MGACMLSAWNDWRARRLLVKGNVLYQDRNFKQAAAIAGHASRAASSQGLRWLAMVLRSDYMLHAGDKMEATRLLKEAVAGGAGATLLVHRKLARQLIAQQDFEGAIENCMKSLEVDGPARDTFDLLGDAHLRLGHAEPARHWFRKGLNADPSNAHAAAMLQSLDGAAVPVSERPADEADPILGIMKAGTGELVLDRGALQESLPGGGSGDRDRVREAMALIERHELDQAEALLRPVSDRCPRPYRAEFVVGDRLFIRCWDLPDFLLRGAVRRGSGRELAWLPSVYPRAHFYMAAICRARGEFQAAADWLKRGLALEPDSPRFLNMLGATYADASDCERALECFEAASRIEMAKKTDTSTALRGAAAVLSKLGRQAEAESRMNRAKSFET